MKLVIDGYNILKQRYGGEFINERTRTSLVRQLNTYATLRYHEIVLVFDGGPSLWPTREIVYPTTIFYAGAGKSADDSISAYVAEHSNEDILLVTSDRELAHKAASYGIASVGSMDFLQCMLATIAGTKKQCNTVRDTIVKTTEGSLPSVDALMEEASRCVEDKDAVCKNISDRYTNNRRITESKIERLLRKKARKL